jgi:hypothetical protein
MSLFEPLPHVPAANVVAKTICLDAGAAVGTVTSLALGLGAGSDLAGSNLIATVGAMTAGAAVGFVAVVLANNFLNNNIKEGNGFARGLISASILLTNYIALIGIGASPANGLLKGGAGVAIFAATVTSLLPLFGKNLRDENLALYGDDRTR